MQRGAKSWLRAAVLLTSVGVWAQPSSQPFRDSNLFARLSYDHSGFTQEEELRQICVAVSRDGVYRLVRSLNGQTQRLQGKLEEQQLRQLRKLISDSDFRGLFGSHGGLIRQEAESFGAEILRAEGTQRVQWLNGDGESPFPGSVANVVNWLKDLEATDGKPFVGPEYPDVCPSVGLRLLETSRAATLPSGMGG